MTLVLLPRLRLPCKTEGRLPGPEVWIGVGTSECPGNEPFGEPVPSGSCRPQGHLEKELTCSRLQRPSLFQEWTPSFSWEDGEGVSCTIPWLPASLIRMSHVWPGHLDLIWAVLICVGGTSAVTCGVQLSTDSRDLFFSQGGQVTGPTNPFPKTERSPGLAEFFLYTRWGGFSTILQDRFYFHFIDLKKR